MKVGALILGILGGLILLSFGLIGYGLGSLADAGKAGTGSAMKIISLGIPISALVGAGMVMAKPILGSCLMAMSAVAFLLMAGFNFFSLIPLVLLGIAALLGFSSAEKIEKKINTENLNKETNNSYSSSVSNNYEPGARIPNLDQSKWVALLKYDADIALIADRIRPYGQKWLNEFASSYLTLNDKKYLSDIEQKITSAAKKEIEYKEQQELALAKAEAERREQIRIRDEEHKEQLLKDKERRAQIQRERAKFWQDWFSRNKKTITTSGFGIILIASIATFLWFRNLKIKEEQIRLARETAENLAQKFVKENLITCNGFSYIKINNIIAKLNQDIQVAIHEADENWNFASFEVWSSGDDLQYEGGKGWVKNDLLLFGMIQKYGQWIQKDIKKISCSDIREITASKSDAKVLASTIIDSAKQVKNAVDFVLANGCKNTEISFENPLVNGYDNPNAPADRHCHVFDPNGGHISWLTPPAVAYSAVPGGFAHKTYFFDGNKCVTGIGTPVSQTYGSHPCRLNGNPDDVSLVLVTTDLTIPVCDSINSILGINAIGNSNGVWGHKFVGSYIKDVTGGFDASTTAGHTMGCAMVDGAYIYFYAVLLTRYSDIQEITVRKNPPFPNPLPPSSSNHTDSVHQNLADTAIAHTSENSYRSSPENKNPWIFPDSDKRYLTDNEIKNLSTDDLWKARNEIYAKKGYIFNTDRGRQYAQSLGSFYSGIETDVKKIYRQLNNYEKYNVKLIQKYEK